MLREVRGLDDRIAALSEQLDRIEQRAESLDSVLVNLGPALEAVPRIEALAREAVPTLERAVPVVEQATGKVDGLTTTVETASEKVDPLIERIDRAVPVLEQAIETIGQALPVMERVAELAGAARGNRLARRPAVGPLARAVRRDSPNAMGRKSLGRHFTSSG